MATKEDWLERATAKEPALAKAWYEAHEALLVRWGDSWDMRVGIEAPSGLLSWDAELIYQEWKNAGGSTGYRNTYPNAAAFYTPVLDDKDAVSYVGDDHKKLKFRLAYTNGHPSANGGIAEGAKGAKKSRIALSFARKYTPDIVVVWERFLEKMGQRWSLTNDVEVLFTCEPSAFTKLGSYACDQASCWSHQSKHLARACAVLEDSFVLLVYHKDSARELARMWGFYSERYVLLYNSYGIDHFNLKQLLTPIMDNMGYMPIEPVELSAKARKAGLYTHNSVSFGRKGG